MCVSERGREGRRGGGREGERERERQTERGREGERERERGCLRAAEVPLWSTLNTENPASYDANRLVKRAATPEAEHTL